MDQSVALQTYTGTLLVFALLFEILIEELQPKVLMEEVQSSLNPMLEVIPVQVAAYSLATWLGYKPGEFRYLGSVVDDETRFG